MIKFEVVKLSVSSEPLQVNVGDKIGQGIFLPFLLADDDESDGKRVGGMGSTGG